MAISSFTSKFELNEEGLDRLIDIANSENKTVTKPIKLPKYDINNDEFIRECLGLSDYKT